MRGVALSPGWRVVALEGGRGDGMSLEGPRFTAQRPTWTGLACCRIITHRQQKHNLSPGWHRSNIRLTEHDNPVEIAWAGAILALRD